MVVPSVPIDTKGSEQLPLTSSEGNWVATTTSVQGISFEYPDPLPAVYVSAVEWPPSVSRGISVLNCAEGTMAGAGGEIATAKRQNINGQDYCVAVSGEGAAGSTYTSYEYRTAQNDAVIGVSFTLRTPQCSNYDDPERTACMTEQAAFSVDGLAAGILASVKPY